jgi:spoIIIJ-associated protein
METEHITTEIQTILEKMGFLRDLETIEVHHGTASRFEVRIHGEARMLIGERGNNLAAFEHVLKKIVKKKHNDEVKFTLDINDYRMRRLEDLKQEVKTAAKDVRLYRKDVPLRAMTAFERRIVHLLLEEYPDITTQSIGIDPERRVVIKSYP